jgi:hypothetical protein
MSSSYPTGPGMSISSVDGLLFSVTDQPVVEALGMYREQALGENRGRQEIKAQFRSR